MGVSRNSEVKVFVWCRHPYLREHGSEDFGHSNRFVTYHIHDHVKIVVEVDEDAAKHRCVLSFGSSHVEGFGNGTCL
jgi:hypothetical protein